MTYATKQDLIDRFGATELIQRTDRTNRPPTTIDDTIVERALTDASAVANGYLRKIYTVPVPSVPGDLVKHVADIARFYLYGNAAEKDGPVARAHDQAIAWLKDVSRGLVDLGTAEPETAAEPAGGGSVRAVAPDRVFTRDSLRGA